MLASCWVANKEAIFVQGNDICDAGGWGGGMTWHSPFAVTEKIDLSTSIGMDINWQSVDIQWAWGEHYVCIFLALGRNSEINSRNPWGNSLIFAIFWHSVGRSAIAARSSRTIFTYFSRVQGAPPFHVGKGRKGTRSATKYHVDHFLKSHSDQQKRDEALPTIATSSTKGKTNTKSIHAATTNG